MRIVSAWSIAPGAQFRFWAGSMTSTVCPDAGGAELPRKNVMRARPEMENLSGDGAKLAARTSFLICASPTRVQTSVAHDRADGCDCEKICRITRAAAGKP